MAGTLRTLALDRFPTPLGSPPASMARFYDAMLSGKDNLAAEQALARRVTAAAPTMRRLFHRNRGFVARAVRHMAAGGIDQFLDLGCGLPTGDNSHQVAQRCSPHARVVYVDHDPVVLAHSGARLTGNAQTAVVDADLRDPEAVFDAAETRRLLDPDRPVGILLTSVLHHIPDADDPHGLVRSYLSRVPTGSVLALSHFHAPGDGGTLDEQAHRVQETLLAELGSGWFRSRPAIAALFDGLVLGGQGLRPLHPTAPSLALCGLGHKAPGSGRKP